MDNDGTEPFGELSPTDPEPLDWNTPEWRAAMLEKYRETEG